MLHKRNIILAYFIAFVISFVFLGFIVVALLNSGFYFANRIISSSACITVFYFILFVHFYIKYYRSGKIFCLKNLLFFLLTILLGFWYVNIIWDSGYLTLFSVKKLLSGEAHIDTLFHSTIAESFITNGYSSIQFNTPSYLPYHYLSHFVLSLFSRLLRVPVFYVYNYIYPVFFIPVFIILTISVITEFRLYYKLDPSLSLADIAFLYLLLTGVMPLAMLEQTGIFFTSTYRSESYFLSLITFLLFSRITFLFLNKNLLNNKHIKRLYLYLLLPLSIIIMSGMKISVGFLFTAGICYLYFRKTPFKLSSWGYIFFYVFFFVVSCFLYIFNPNSQSKNYLALTLFHYVKNYVQQDYIILHYIVLFAPCLFIFVHRTRYLSLNLMYFNQKKHIFEETLILLSILGALPGVLLAIDGASAAYFSLPIFFISLLCILGFNIIDDICCTQKRRFFVYLFITAFIMNWMINIHPLYTLKSTIITRITNYEKMSIKQSISERNFFEAVEKTVTFVFSTVEESNAAPYVLLNKILELTNKDKNEYCIYFDKSSSFLTLYPMSIYPQLAMKNHFMLTGYLGLPILNAIYESDRLCYRNDEQFVATKEKMYNANYGLATVILQDLFTLDEAYERAKKLRKRFIIYLYDDTFEVIPVENYLN